jgi:hypothetical protein
MAFFLHNTNCETKMAVDYSMVAKVAQVHFSRLFLRSYIIMSLSICLNCRLFERSLAFNFPSVYSLAMSSLHFGTITTEYFISVQEFSQIWRCR